MHRDQEGLVVKVGGDGSILLQLYVPLRPFRFFLISLQGKWRQIFSGKEFEHTSSTSCERRCCHFTNGQR